jgi:hypothetical protein
MEHNYKNLLYVQGRSPDHLKELLMALDCPSQILSGSWYHTPMKAGVWVYCDREVKKVKVKDIPKVKKIEDTKTTINKEV